MNVSHMITRIRCNARAHRPSRGDITGPLVTWTQASGVACIDLHARATNAIYCLVNQSPHLVRHCPNASLLPTPFSAARSRLPNTSPPLSTPFSRTVTSGVSSTPSCRLLSPLSCLVNTDALFPLTPNQILIFGQV